ncbi:helix-turn-helix domain-containing protein [Pseudomonas aeruginosa]|uniref:helix-turn-helix domain-containing protein n=1 Tax=Pseudomonas aeruginosa TaxID=287 RepID=UPI0039E0DE2F
MNVLKPNKRATILTLLERGKSQREIARLTGIDRKTVKGYRERWLAEGANSPGVATGSEVAVATPGQQTPPPWAPAGLPGAPTRGVPPPAFIHAPVRLGRKRVGF